MIKYVIDRIEGDIAVCEREDRVFVDIPLSELDDNVKEGDYIALIGGVYCLEHYDTGEARNKNIELQNSLFEDE